MSDRKLSRAMAVTAVAALSLLAAACGGSPNRPVAALKVSTTATSTTTTTTTIPPTTTTTTSVCELNTPVDGCPLGTPAAIAWAQQQNEAGQAAATAEAEQAYQQCLDEDAQADAYAIAQAFGKPVPPGTPPWQPCTAPSTAATSAMPTVTTTEPVATTTTTTTPCGIVMPNVIGESSSQATGTIEDATGGRASVQTFSTDTTGIVSFTDPPPGTVLSGLCSQDASDIQVTITT